MKKQEEWAIVLFSLSILFVGTGGQNNCAAGDRVGNRNRGDNKKNGLTDVIATTVIIMDTNNPSHEVDCCGKVTQFRMKISDDHATTPISLQVWRPVPTTSNFILVGEENYTPPGKDNREVVPASTIYVQPGDKLGFTGNALRWEAKTGNDQNLQKDVYSEVNLNPVVGVPPNPTEYTLNNEHPLADAANERVGFAIEMLLEQRDNPTCTITLAAASFPEDSPSGTTIGTVSHTAVDPFITGYTYTITSATGIPLTIDGTTGVITTTANLTAADPSTDYTITTRATEDICFKFGSCTETVTVVFKNHNIVIVSLPTTGSLIESTTAKTEIHLIDTADMNRNTFRDQNPTCIIAGMNPAGGPFDIEATGNSAKFSLVYTAAANLLPHPQTYTISVKCDDEYGSSDTQPFTLTVTENMAPTVTNTLDASSRACNNVSAMATSMNAVVLNLLTTDTEGDTIIVNNFVRTSPTDSPFAWNSGTHEVYATKDLKDQEISLFEFTVDVSDRWNAAVTQKLCLHLTNLNSKPEFSDCPGGTKSVDVMESYSTGAVVHTVHGTDSNKDRDSQTFTFTYSVNPASFASYLTLGASSGTIALASAIDYETTKDDLAATSGCIELTINLNDGIHSAVQNCKLCLLVKDENEPPVLDTDTFTLDWNEQAAASPITLSSISLTYADPDIGDMHTYSKPSGDSDGYFAIDSSTGEVTQIKAIDYEAITSKTIVFVARVQDAGGMFSEALITINVVDVNDNTPTFTDPTQSTITVSDTTATGSTLRTETITDADSGDNAQLDCKILGTGMGATYFEFDNTGALKLKKQIDYRDDTEFIMSACCTDRGTPTLTGCKTILVQYPKQIITTEPFSNEQPCFLCTPGGVAIFTMLMLIAAIVCAAALVALWIFCLREPVSRLLKRIFAPRKPFQGPKKPPPRRPRVSPPRSRRPTTPIKKKPFKPAEPVQTTKFDFWRTTDMEMNATDPKPSVTTLPF